MSHVTREQQPESDFLLSTRSASNRAENVKANKAAAQHQQQQVDCFCVKLDVEGFHFRSRVSSILYHIFLLLQVGMHHFFSTKIIEHFCVLKRSSYPVVCAPDEGKKGKDLVSLEL